MNRKTPRKSKVAGCFVLTEWRDSCQRWVTRTLTMRARSGAPTEQVMVPPYSSLAPSKHKAQLDHNTHVRMVRGLA